MDKKETQKINICINKLKLHIENFLQETFQELGEIGKALEENHLVVVVWRWEFRFTFRITDNISSSDSQIPAQKQYY